MKGKNWLVAAITVSLMVSFGFAGDIYNLDKAHSSVNFSVKHMVISNTTGKFKDFDATIDYDADDITNSSVKATIKTASIFTNDQKRDNHLKSDDFLNAEKFPEITFVSKSIEETEDGLVAVGDLTIRDVTKEVELPFEILGTITDPWGNERLGAEAKLTINRQDYGVKWNKTLDNGGLVVGDDVKITLSIEAIKQKADKS